MTASIRLAKNSRYYPAALVVYCWVNSEGGLADSQGLYCGDYFDADCYYRGPDENGIEPVFTEESALVSEVALILAEAGERFAGNDAIESARDWYDHDFDASEVADWCDIGCWNPSVAAQWRDAGLTPHNVKAAAESMVDGSSEPDVEWTDSCPIYSCCNGDTETEEILEEHEYLTGKAPLYGRDGLRLYDLDPAASELWVVAGPDGWKIEDIDPDNLPAGFRWVSDEEWQFANSRR